VVLTALRGAVGFLTRLPIGRSERAWEALGATPAVMVPTAYVIGVLAAVPLIVLPGSTAGLAYPAILLALTGIAHPDGLADLADAAVVHGSPAERREVMHDTVTGVGGTVALALDLVGLALAGFALADAPVGLALAIVVAAEVGAKLSMVGLAVLGGTGHPGMGAHLLGASPGQLVLAVGLAIPAGLLGWPALVPAVALIAALVTAAIVAGWARSRLGGLSGDVFGATNELARLVALHAGVVAWMHW
jgi:adenosylcobinamide-GDP ribazoletransferase